MRGESLTPALLIAGAIAASAAAEEFHSSARVIGGNQVFTYDADCTLLGEYDQIGSAYTDAWGYRDGASDGGMFGAEHVYFGWGGGVVRHDADGTNGTLLFDGANAPGGTWRALAFDCTGDGGNGSIWSASFGSELVEVDLNGNVLNTFPNGGWSLYGMAWDCTDGNLWAHDSGGNIIKINADSGSIIPGVACPSPFPNLAAQGGMSAYKCPGCNGCLTLLALVSQGTPDELGVMDWTTCQPVLGPCDLEGPSGSNGHLGIAVTGAACGPDCPWDLDNDGVVNVLDLLMLLAGWGPCPPPCPADFNGDGEVNVPDLLLVLANWGPCP